MFIERFFGLKQWKSVKELQYLCGRLDFISLLDFCKPINFCISQKLKYTCGSTCFWNLKVMRLYYSYNICVGIPSEPSLTYDIRCTCIEESLTQRQPITV